MRYLIVALLLLFIGCDQKQASDHPKPVPPTSPEQPDSSSISGLLTDEEWVSDWSVWSNSMPGSKPCIIVMRKSFPNAHHVSLHPHETVLPNGKKKLIIRIEEAVGIQTKNTLRIDYNCRPEEFVEVSIVVPTGAVVTFTDFLRTE